MRRSKKTTADLSNSDLRINVNCLAESLKFSVETNNFESATYLLERLQSCVDELKKRG